MAPPKPEWATPEGPIGRTVFGLTDMRKVVDFLTDVTLGVAREVLPFLTSLPGKNVFATATCLEEVSWAASEVRLELTDAHAHIASIVAELVKSAADAVLDESGFCPMAVAKVLDRAVTLTAIDAATRIDLIAGNIVRTARRKVVN